MKLQTARIQKYKSVEDSEEWRVDQVTCLVGKNEAGKSAILEALYKLNPVDEAGGEFTETDYPRRAALTDAGKNDLKYAKAIITKWTLDQTDIDLIADEIPELGIANDTIIEVAKGYSGKGTWDTQINEEQAVATLIESAHFNAAEKASVGAPSTIDNLFAALEKIAEPTDKQSSLLASLKGKYPKKNRNVWCVDLFS